jgi:hypothetical protein
MHHENLPVHFSVQGMPLIAKHLETTEFVAEKLPAGSSHLIAGVTAGIIGATLSHPFDTIKVRLQILPAQ